MGTRAVIPVLAGRIRTPSAALAMYVSHSTRFLALCCCCCWSGCVGVIDALAVSVSTSWTLTGGRVRTPCRTGTRTTRWISGLDGCIVSVDKKISVTHISNVDALLLADDDPVVRAGLHVVRHANIVPRHLVAEPRERSCELDIERERAALI